MSMQKLSEVVKRNHFVVLDTETTGLYSGSQVVQIAGIDQDGNVLVDTLVKPTIPIPADATAIHGITDDMVIAAPNFLAVTEQLAGRIDGHDLIIYNADYDLARVFDSLYALDSHDEAREFWQNTWRSVVCAMHAYAEFYGEWNEYHQSYTWQRLSAACSQQSLPVIDAHNALGDCRMTLALVRKICAAADQ